MEEFNDDSDGNYIQPLTVAYDFNDDWEAHTKNLSSEEIEDLDKARSTLENYEKVYNIFEYATEITRLCNMVEIKVCANNPSLPMNVYRRSSATNF